ncbi:hypothetical protein ACC691_39505, partial [Rhizobium johnstonii]|uniref:hypothetical protein n=1 Tax=Rhizobium johnstonii TaxID=3019933 RepID=UPI003F983CB9
MGRHIGGAFHRVAQASTPLSDSGIETIPRLRFAELGIRMEPQVSVDGHRLDGRIGERLLLQFDGLGPHSSRAQREKDLREDAR